MKKITLFVSALLAAVALNAQNSVSLVYGFETGETIDKWASSALTWEVDSLGAAHTGVKCMKATVTDVTGLDPWSLQWVPQGFIITPTCYRYTVWTKAENLTGIDKTGATVDASINITAGNYQYQDRGSKYGVLVSQEWTMTTLLIDLTNPDIYAEFSADSCGNNWPAYLTDAGLTHALRLPIHLGACTNVVYVDDIKVIESFLADASMETSTKLVLDFGYLMEDAGINPAAFTVKVNGTEVAATAGELDETQFKLILTLASEVAEGDEVVVTVAEPANAGILYVGDGPSSNVTEGYIPVLNETVSTENLGGGTGIIAAANSFEVGVYPNPAVGNKINVVSASQITEVAIYDIAGKQIMLSSVNLINSVELNISELNAGIYVVKVTDAKGEVASRKFIK